MNGKHIEPVIEVFPKLSRLSPIQSCPDWLLKLIGSLFLQVSWSQRDQFPLLELPVGV